MPWIKTTDFNNSSHVSLFIKHIAELVERLLLKNYKQGK